jgi:hypothetical protein
VSCSTCDGYEFVPNPEDPDGLLVDCPDCRARDGRSYSWCPVHSKRVRLDGTCPSCVREAERATRAILARHSEDLAAAIAA